MAAPTITAVTPSIVAARGGSVVLVEGTNFDDSIVVKIGTVAQVPAYVVDVRFDLQPTQVFVALPAMSLGEYDVIVETGAGTDTLALALEYQRFAEEIKAHRVRISFGSKWKVGPRLLSNNTIGLSV